MELKKRTSWRDVTINEYYELVNEINDPALADYDIAVKKVSFSSGLSEDEVWSLSIPEFRNRQAESMWMNEFSINDNPNFKEITIDGEKYTVDTNLQNFTVAQYVDFQTLYPKRKNDIKILGNILACFIIPKGKKYADGYDIQSTAMKINECLDIMTAQEIMFFFLKQLLISTRATANYLNWQMKRMSRRTKDKEKAQKLEESWEKMKRDMLAMMKTMQAPFSDGFH